MAPGRRTIFSARGDFWSAGGFRKTPGAGIAGAVFAGRLKDLDRALSESLESTTTTKQERRMDFLSRSWLVSISEFFVGWKPAGFLPFRDLRAVHPVISRLFRPAIAKTQEIPGDSAHRFRRPLVKGLPEKDLAALKTG